LEREEIWRALVDTAHALLMYKNHKRYVEDVMLKEKPDISPNELAIQLNIPLGESLVILAETRSETGTGKGQAGEVKKGDDRSLFDFTR